MRAGRVVLAGGLLLAGALPAQAWMTFVGRNVDTGERIGLGASVSNEDEAAQLAFLCTPQGLTATFMTGIPVTPDMRPAEMTTPLALAADDGPYEPFVVTAGAFDRGDGPELRLDFSHSEAMGLAEYVLNAANDIVLSYHVDGEEAVRARYDNDSAAISIGAVLGECEGRGKAKS